MRVNRNIITIFYFTVGRSFGIPHCFPTPFHSYIFRFVLLKLLSDGLKFFFLVLFNYLYIVLTIVKYSSKLFVFNICTKLYSLYYLYHVIFNIIKFNINCNKSNFLYFILFLILIFGIFLLILIFGIFLLIHSKFKVQYH